MAGCFHQFTCYIPLSPKDWDVEKFTSSFYSFMVNYNVLDKVWLVMRRLRPGLRSDLLNEGVRTSAVHTAPSSSSITCLPHSSIFFSLNYSIGSVKICQYISKWEGVLEFSEESGKESAGIWHFLHWLCIQTLL